MQYNNNSDIPNSWIYEQNMKDVGHKQTSEDGNLKISLIIYHQLICWWRGVRGREVFLGRNIPNRGS